MNNYRTGRVGRTPLALMGALILTIALFAIACSDEEEPARAPAAMPTATEAAPTATAQPSAAQSTPAAPQATATAAPATPASPTPTPVQQPTENAAACVDSYDAEVDYFPHKVEVNHATEWDVRYERNYKVVTVDALVVGRPENVAETYVLVQCGTPAPDLSGDLGGAFVIQVPVQTIVEAGGGVFGAIEALGVSDRLVGWRGAPGGVEHSPSIAARAGDIELIGNYGSSPEPIVALAPDLMITYESAEAFQQYRGLDLPVVYFSPFTESPLGSAEQLKWLALFLNMEAEANEQFGAIEGRYMELSARARSVTDPPTVLIGFVSSSGNFGTGQWNPLAIHAALVHDAGGVDPLASLYQEDQTFTRIPLEQAIAFGASADYWYHQAYDPSAETVAEFIEANPQEASFAALERGHAFHRFGRSLDFFATAGVRADWLIEDIVSIIHPDLLPDHELRFLKVIRP